MPAEQHAAISTNVHESALLPVPVQQAWQLVRPLTFQWLTSAVKDVQVSNGTAAEVGSQRRVQYIDGTVQVLRVVELSDLEYSVTWQVIASEPAVSVTSVINTMRLRRVTLSNETLVEWITDFSGDATAGVVQDSKYKKHEAFADLIKALKQSGKRANEHPSPATAVNKKATAASPARK